MYLFFDCETTGTSIPGKKYSICMDNVAIASYLVQLSWKLVDTDGNTIEDVDHIIRPHGYHSIPIDSSNIHGITIDIAYSKGVDLKEVLMGPFLQALAQADLIVAHNAQFDVKIVLFSALRSGCYEDIYGHLRGKSIVCTMINTRQYCQAKDRRGRLKMPRLDELHLRVFGRPLVNAHNAKYDVDACHKIYMALNNDIAWSTSVLQ